ncbi:putative protein argonaute [Rosa chinensis]|uniref:Protein argonaute N-terminal domain-containing protein n=1 Tax=Rosa chinensis TaxID=74649 RepID=A0A2P6QGL0_ROSCH|nr:putative protein argonaute [Rosa chinensis]
MSGARLTQTPAYSPPAALSSSAPPVASLSREMEQKLTLETTTTVAVVPPESSIPKRPGFGTVGKKIQVRANHFLVQVADRDLHHYGRILRYIGVCHTLILLNILDHWISNISNSSKYLTNWLQTETSIITKEVMNQQVRLYSETHLGKIIPAYDGVKSLYTAGPLPFSSQEFVVKLLPNDGRAAGSSTSSKRLLLIARDREFKVALTLANKPDLYQLQQFLRSQHVETPQEAILLRTLNTRRM